MADLSAAFARLIMTLGLAAAVLGPTSMSADPAMSGIRCELRVTDEGGLVRIDAIVTARENASGMYRLDVLKKSASGTTNNLQSGLFELGSNRETILTTVLLDQSARGHYRATLTVESNIGRVTCVSP